MQRAGCKGFGIAAAAMAMTVPLLASCDGQAARREAVPGAEGGAAGAGSGMGGAQQPLPPVNSGPCALSLTEVALYQAVKIPLAVPDAALGIAGATLRSADVVQGRPALVRAFATPTEGWQGVATARLTLVSANGNKTYDASNDLRRPSNDLQFDSTFNFQILGSDVKADTEWRVDMVSPTSCAGIAVSRFPNQGTLGLAARETGLVKVLIVPVQYDTDDSGRLPDITDLQVERYRSLIMSMYPVTGVEISVREPVKTSLGVDPASGWEDLLDALRQLRQKDRAAADVHYYGVINPAASFSTYCGRGCTAGIAYVTKEQQPSLRVGVGVGFTGNFAAQTLAHELGHQHGRLHSPCNVDGDPKYPYEKGAIGVWGFDSTSSRVIDPAGFTDVMGYCNPTWVSDYTYQGFLEHLAFLKSQPTVQALKVEQTWNVLLVHANGTAKWGHPLTSFEVPAGVAEVAQVYDEDGNLTASPTVYRTAIADSETSMVWVPTAGQSWVTVVVKGARAHRFDAPVATPTLR